MHVWGDVPRNAQLAGLSAYVKGEGPDLVLIHGVGLRAEAWAAMIPALQTRFRVWAIDLPGHGNSPWQDLYSIDDYAAAIEQALGEIGRPVHVVGHSMGAMIALAMATRQRAPIGRIAALNAIFKRPAKAALQVQARADALASESAPDPTPTLHRWFGHSPAGALAQASEACGRWLMSCDQAGYAQAYRVFAEHDGPEPSALRELTTPALFLTGADEPNSTPAMSTAMANLVPVGRAHIVQNAAHMAPMTHGVEIAGELIAFLSGDESDS